MVCSKCARRKRARHAGPVFHPVAKIELSASRPGDSPLGKLLGLLLKGTHMQKTVARDLRLTGIGLHSGKPANLMIRPAVAGAGITFHRKDVTDADPWVPARWDLVQRTPLCTKIVNSNGVSVATIEHLMAALAGCGVLNAEIIIDGPEVPILDGSAQPFVAALLDAGIVTQDAPVSAIRILKPVEVSNDHGAIARLDPADLFEIAFDIDFTDAAIGRQSKTLTLANGSFVKELCDCRTFCRQADVDAMRKAGLALGGSYDNAVVVDGASVLSPGGLRRSDEPVRHKMLDALGDLALAGAPILARYHGVKAGHALTNTLLRALFTDPTAWRHEVCAPEIAARLPGIGVSTRDLPRAA